MRWLVIALAAALAWVSLATAQEPTLRTARTSGRHVVVTFAPGDLIPAEVEVATRAARTASGGFVAANTKLRERITAQPDPVTGIIRYRTRGTVAPGTYYVAVSGIVQDPPASCGKVGSRCAERWSNAVRVTVRP